MASYAHQNETSSSRRVANCEAVAAFVGSWEVQRSDVLKASELDRASLGAANCDAVETFVGSWGV